MNKIIRSQAAVCLALVRETDRAVIADRQSADQVLARVYRRHREYGARDRRFFSNAVFSWFRWRGWLETPDDRRVAAALLLDAAEIPPQAEYMAASSGRAGAGLKALGALSLEEKAAGLQALLESGPRRIEQLAPDWLADFLFIPPDRDKESWLRRCLEAFQSRPPVWIRLRRGGEDSALSRLVKAGYVTECHPLLSQAVFIKGGKQFDAALFPEIQVQDLASQCAGLCCSPQPGEKWWDVCAGSGGKSLHLADLMRDCGQILATDVRPAILEQLSRRLRRDRHPSIRPLSWDGSADPAPGTCFDGVLIDAPCSGLGTWARNPDARWRMSAGQIADYAVIQQNLLQIAAQKVKPGGRLVYATCSLTEAENTGAVNAFLQREKGFYMETTANPLTRAPAGGLIWIWPWEGNCNGFFLAVMRRAGLCYPWW
ncbi:MAG: RsmB/NOP family class I SAM-dependent RNA methyltransferase [Kiritimatiellae bacterium]|nr:RsmB/NOP family class I SAM-dependent RNA methyltransferase [Kiritimatiellia bacterium]